MMPCPGRAGLCYNPLINGTAPPGEEASLLPTRHNLCSPTTPRRSAPPEKRVPPPGGLTWTPPVSDHRLRTTGQQPRLVPPLSNNGIPSSSRDSRP